VVAGYPWFTDWGRDAFISLRGLCIATGRLTEARSILLEWAGHVSEGMLPNRFADQGDAPEYNTVDATLWYIVAVHDYLRARGARAGRDGPRSPGAG
jgi:predicted glycogen debranching enzyme